eukprot:gb/GECG01004345.1/.p1 GENE.gb/GECG01004345.1/~~gb/GECG01004345.1/.p1  ORF type:complete len:1061 (+),score=110.46 gb/GECG01004345.1/:1-3183(+)
MAENPACSPETSNADPTSASATSKDDTRATPAERDDTAVEQQSSESRSSRNATRQSCPPHVLVHGIVEDFWEWVGYNVAKRPKHYIIGSLLFVIVCAFGMLKMEQITDLNRAWYPRNTPAFRQNTYIESAYPAEPVNLIFLGTSQNGGNILNPEVLRETIDIHNLIQSLPGYEELCLLANDNKCMSVSITSIWDYDPNQLPSTEEATVAELNQPREDGVSVSISSTLGSIQRDRAGNITAAEALQMMYPLDNSDVDKTQNFELKYINAMLVLRRGGTFREAAEAGGLTPSGMESIAERPLKYLNADFIASRSFSDESDRQISSDSPLVAGAVVLMVLYVSVVLGGRPFRHSKIGLSLMAVGTIGLSLVCGFGVGAYFGNPFNVMSQLAIFIVMGIGIDDIFIIVDSFDRFKHSKSEELQLAAAFREAGPTVTLTSITDFVAFLIGSTIDLPAIRQFSITAGLSIVAVFITQATLFAPLLLLDNRREAEGRYDICCCKQVSLEEELPAEPPADKTQSSDTKPPVAYSPDPSKTSCVQDKELSERPLRQLVRRFYTPLLEYPMYRGSVLVIFLGWAAYSLTLALRVEKGLRNIDFLGDGSYPREFLVKQDDHFGAANVRFQWYFLYGMDLISKSGNLLPSKPSVKGLQPTDSVTMPPFDQYDGIENGTLRFTAQDTEKWIDIGSKRSRMSLRVAAERIRRLPRIHLPTTFWFEEFESWEVSRFLNGTNFGSMCLNLDLLSTGDTFLQRAHAFLRENPEYQESVVWESRKGYQLDQDEVYGSDPNSMFIVSHRFVASHGQPEDMDARLKEMDDMRLVSFDLEVAADSLALEKWDCRNGKGGRGFLSFGFEQNHLWYERFIVIDELAITNLFIAALCVFVVVSLFHPIQNAICVTVCVILTDIDLLGMMFLWGMRINVTSLVVLVMAIGFSVDYSGHIAEAFVISNASTRIKRSMEALENMGVSVMNGGLSTMLAVLMLAFTQSAGFRILFKMFFGLAMFGLLHGLVFLPVLLSFVGPMKFKPDRSQAQNWDSPTEENLKVSSTFSPSDPNNVEISGDKELAMV